MKRYIKFTVDFFAILLIPCLFAVKNNIWHEILGLVFLALIIAHFILNFNKLKTSSNNKFNLIFNIIIAVCILFLAVTGILNSEYIFNFINISNQQILSSIHMFTAIIVFVLVAVHVGINIKNIKEVKNTSQSDLKSNKVKVIAISGILILTMLYGLYACYAQQIWNNFIQPFDYSKAGNEIKFDNNQDRPSMPDGAGQDSNTNKGSSDSYNTNNSDTNNGDNNTPPNNNGGSRPGGQAIPGKQSLNSLWYKTLIDYMSIFVLFSSASYFIAKLASKPKKNNNDEKVKISQI